MQFAAVDMGDVAPAASTILTALRAPDMDEKSQYVLLHLALAVDWIRRNSPVRAINKSRVNPLSAHRRPGEYQHALRCFYQVENPHTPNQDKRMGETRHVTIPRRCRNARVIQCPLWGIRTFLLAFLSGCLILYGRSLLAEMMKLRRMSSPTAAPIQGSINVYRPRRGEGM